MGQEFSIKSEAIESKINQLLPSQGGYGAGVDFSASTTVIPIVDLTETAEGSSVRADLQTAISHDTATAFNVGNVSRQTILTTTGYWRLIGSIGIFAAGSKSEAQIILNDGVTDKVIFGTTLDIGGTTTGRSGVTPFDFIIFLNSGDSLIMDTTVDVDIVGSARQIADISGNLINP